MSRTGLSGSRVGAGAAGEPPRGPAAPRQWVTFRCPLGHSTDRAFAEDVDVPGSWDCTCGRPAVSSNADGPVGVDSHRRQKTHLDQLLSRRDPATASRLLGEALQQLKDRRSATMD